MVLESRRLTLGVCVAAPLLTVASTASAQWRYLFPEGFTMTKDDLDRQRAAAQSLLGKEPPPVGENASWSNPKTSTRGTVTMVDARDARGRSPCRRIRYEVSTDRVKEPVNIDFTVCRAPDGKWKAAN